MLESRHVIGLFMLMLLFSGVFFTLGYVMGRNEIDGPVRAATDFFTKPSSSVLPKNWVSGLKRCVHRSVRRGRTMPDCWGICGPSPGIIEAGLK